MGPTATGKSCRLKIPAPETGAVTSVKPGSPSIEGRPNFGECLQRLQERIVDIALIHFSMQRLGSDERADRSGRPPAALLPGAALNARCIL